MRRVDCMRPLRTWLLCMLVTVPVMAAESVLLLHGIARRPAYAAAGDGLSSERF